jgi:hypothetical protein
MRFLEWGKKTFHLIIRVLSFVLVSMRERMAACLLGKGMMKISPTVFVLLLVVFFMPASVARATIVDANEEWGMTLKPGESFTCIAHFIPDIPLVSDSLVFSAAPEWTDTWDFDYLTEGWQTAWSVTEPKIAYLYGPRLTNETPNEIALFSFQLYYQWDDEAGDFDPNCPIYQDVIMFDDQEIRRAYGISGNPDGLWNPPKPDGPYYDDEPYENPIPEPVAIFLLGFGAAFLRKRR